MSYGLKEPVITTFTEIKSACEAYLPDVIWTQLKAAVRVAKLVLILPLPNIVRTHAERGGLIRYNCGNAQHTEEMCGFRDCLSGLEVMSFLQSSETLLICAYSTDMKKAHRSHKLQKNRKIWFRGWLSEEPLKRYIIQSLKHAPQNQNYVANCPISCRFYHVSKFRRDY